METFVLIVAVFAILWVVYWAILRPTLLALVQDDLDRLRADAEWSIIDGKEAAESQAAHLLVFAVSETQAACTISFSQLWFAAWINRRELKAYSERRQKLFANSPLWIREARRKFVWLMMRAALINSPLWWLFLPPILLASHLSIKVYVWWNDVQDNVADNAQASTLQKVDAC